jgi:tRNA nucleotidyltransferase/poly(A) polymerase
MLPDIAKPLFDAFAKFNEELYLVGGSVRDYVMHNMDRKQGSFEPKDLDFATSAFPEQTAHILRSIKLPVYPIGMEFGTVATKLAQFDVEITTYRCKESYTKGSRKPEVKFGDSLLADLKRRDFTINAIAMDRDGVLYDPFCGSMSAMEGVLLTPTEDPTEIFIDDPLRMLRGFRFESQLNLGLAEAEENAIRKFKDQIHHVSMERIFQEMSKLLVTKKPGLALDHMAQTGLLGEIFPELQTVIDFKQNQGKWHSKLVWPHTLDVVDNAPPILEVRWAALFHDVAKPATYSETETGVHFYHHDSAGALVWNDIADRMKVSKDFKREVNFLIFHHLRLSHLCSGSTPSVSKSALRRFIRDSDSYLDNLFHLSLADITSHHPDVVKAKRGRCLALRKTLDDLIAECDVRQLKLRKGLGSEIAEALHLPHGPYLGRIMRQLSDDLVSGSLTEDSDFIAAARKIKEKYDGGAA